VTLANYPGETPVLDGTHLRVPPNVDAGLFLLADKSYVAIRGFELRDYSSANLAAVPAGVFLRGACNSIQISNCNIHGIRNLGGRLDRSGNAFGIAVYGSSTTPAAGIVIDGNEVHNCRTGSSETLTLNGNVTGFRVTNNLVHDNNNIGIDFIGFEGTCPDPAQDQARNGLCQGNQAYPHNDYSADGIYVDGGTGIVIQRNISHDNDIGVELASEHDGKLTSQITLRDNFVYRSRQGGLLLGGYAASHTGGTDQCAVTNNSFWNDDLLGWGNGEIQLRWRTSNCSFKQNILFAGASGWVVTVPVSSANNSNNSFDYNLCHAAAKGVAKPAQWVWNNATFAGFAAWQTGSGQDAHSLFADPQYISTGAAPNLHLQAASPAVNAGDPAFVPAPGELDIDGNPRVSGSAVDIGAEELPQVVGSFSR